MKRVNAGFEICARALPLVIAALLLTGCAKTSSVVKTGPSENGVDDMFASLEGTGSAPGAEISNYSGQVRSEIQRHFSGAASYAGKQCALRITLAPDGMLIGVRAEEGGDPDLCRAAIKAAQNARLPKPPSPAAYNATKNAIVEFRP